MAKYYNYLKDGTAYTAKELNDRLESVRDTINALDPESFSHGAFRHEHLPQLIGPSGRDPDVFEAFTASVGVGFASGDVKLQGDDMVPATSVNYPAGIDMAAENVTAFIILANFNIRRFLDKDGESEVPIERSYEDFIGTKFSVMAIDEAGESHLISHTARAISPGWTMANATMDATHTVENNYYWPGQAIAPDRNATFKDLAIRTIVLPEDIEVLGMDRVYGFEIISSTQFLAASTSGMGDPGIELTKRNLTVIPIHAEVRRVT
tara:strand:- start:9282 stop:10076 length:795 start_codon:yes stop_codon:yes gene_type:complete